MRVVFIIFIGENRIGGIYANYDLAARVLEKHITEQGYTYHKTSGDTWVATKPKGAGRVIYHVYPYNVHTE